MARLEAHPDDQDNGRQSEQPEHPRRAPAPRIALADTEQQGSQPDREQRRSPPVDFRAPAAYRRLRNEEVSHHGREGDDDRRHPEDPLVGERIRDHPGEHQARASADSERGADQTDRLGDLLLGELVADDSESQREDGAAGALDGATRDQQRQRMRQRGHHRADAEPDEHRQENLFLAEHVPETPEYRSGDRGGQEINGEHPGDRVLRDAERVLDLRQRRRDHRLGDGVGQGADGEHRERDAIVLAGGDGGGHRSAITSASRRSRTSAWRRSAGDSWS